MSPVPYNPNFSAGPTGLDETRPWITAVADGTFVLANGWDYCRYWDEGSNFYFLGANAPTTFAVADAAGGTTFPIGTVLVYYLVFYNSTLGKETAPQLTSGQYGVTHTMAATKDATITWTDPGGEYDKVRIYRRLQNSDNFRLVATVTASTATYTDSISDAAISATVYVWTYRTTLPPIFVTSPVSAAMFASGKAPVTFVVRSIVALVRSAFTIAPVSESLL